MRHCNFDTNMFGDGPWGLQLFRFKQYSLEISSKMCLIGVFVFLNELSFIFLVGSTDDVQLSIPNVIEEKN
mgnify:FL=1